MGLWTVPAGPAPTVDVKAGTFVTIWAFVCAVFTYLFHRLLRAPNPTWPEFRSIRDATLLLTFWYVESATDRWIHYEQHLLPFGYVLVDPLFRIVQIISTIVYLWGTYDIIWDELEQRFTKPKTKGSWWLLAKATIFIVCLVSFFFVILGVAVALAWLEFLSLNSIADVATKRNNFEMAMTVFFTVFGVLTVVVAVATIVFRARRREGSWEKTRGYLVLATVMLLGRSLAECILTFQVLRPDVRRQDIRLPMDISYGVFTTLYLFLMYLQARQVCSRLDLGAPDVKCVESDIRRFVLDKLRDVTEGTRLEPPTFAYILDQLELDLPAILASGPLSANLPMTSENKEKAARSFIAELRSQFGHYCASGSPQPPTEPHGGRLRGWRDGRRSAPLPAMSSFRSLRSASSSNMRTASSVPDMRHASSQRFAPRGGGHFSRQEQWAPAMAAVEENTVPDGARPPNPPPFAPPDASRYPSFGSRAAAAGFDDGYRDTQGASSQSRRFTLPPQAEPLLPQRTGSSAIHRKQVPAQTTNQSSPQPSGQYLSAQRFSRPLLEQYDQPLPQQQAQSISRQQSQSPPQQGPSLRQQDDQTVPQQNHPSVTRQYRRSAPQLPSLWGLQQQGQSSRQPSSQLLLQATTPEAAHSPAEGSSRSPVNWTYPLQEYTSSATRPSAQGAAYSLPSEAEVPSSIGSTSLLAQPHQAATPSDLSTAPRTYATNAPVNTKEESAAQAQRTASGEGVQGTSREQERRTLGMQLE